MGNRIGKRERTAIGVTSTRYMRDAQARRCLDLLFQQDLAIPVPIFYIGSYITTTSKDSRGTNFTALIRLFEHPIYGSSRLGSYQSGRVVYSRPENQGPYIYQPGLKQYELSNHLGNVLATVSDIKEAVDITIPADGIVDFERAVVKTQQSYYPFGMLQPEMSYTLGGSKYRYGFNGKEKEGEWNEGNYDFGARIYDSRLGRFMAIDPDFFKYPWSSPYAFAINSPIKFIDEDGRGPGVVINNSSSAIVITGDNEIADLVYEGGKVVRSRITLQPGDVWKVVRVDQANGTTLTQGQITRANRKADGTDGVKTFETVPLIDVDHIDVQNGQEMVFVDDHLYDSDSEVNSKSGEDNVGVNVPNKETYPKDTSKKDGDWVADPNKGEIKIRDHGGENKGTMTFKNEVDGNNKKTGKIKVVENIENVTLDH